MIALQTKFKLEDPRLRRALVDLQGAANLAGDDHDESDILDDIMRGPRDPLRIDWAWNIAGQAATQREVRVLALCVQNREPRFPFEDVLHTIFPEQRTKLFRKPTFSATFVARRLACTPKHVLSLVADRLLLDVPNTRRTGRNGSPAITWASITTFLTERRIQ